MTTLLYSLDKLSLGPIFLFAIFCLVSSLWLMLGVGLTGQPIVYPRNDLNYSENFLHMMFSVPTERYEVDPVLSRALEIILILHMDHEQNASTSTVRVAGQSKYM